jgi:hypothetical protein
VLRSTCRYSSHYTSPRSDLSARNLQDPIWGPIVPLAVDRVTAVRTIAAPARAAIQVAARVCAMATRNVVLGSILGLAIAACADTSLASHDDIYSHGADHFVLCAASIDDTYGITVAEIGDALDRAQADDATLHLYTHTPGETIAIATLEGTLAAVAAREMRFATYDDLSGGEVPGSLALSFDDRGIAAWTAMRPLLDRYHARVTFFISGFLTLSEDERAQIQQLAADGHDIEYHSTSHLDAEEYATANGVDAYLAADIIPALEAMRADGYATTIFAYPFGTRTAATDAALSQYFVHLRAIRSRCPQ